MNKIKTLTILLTIFVGVLVGTRNNIQLSLGSVSSNIPQTTIDSFSELRSNNLHTQEEKMIKDQADKYMYHNFGEYYKTSWYDSISASGAVINNFGKLYIIQSKDPSQLEKVKKFTNALLGFFNSNENKLYKVDKVIVVDQDFNTLYSAKTTP